MILGTRLFKTQKAVTEYCQKLLRETPPGRLHPDDQAVIVDLLGKHPDRHTKVGPGIDYVFIRPDPQFHRNQFVLRRTDGSQEPFSYRKCLRPDTTAAEFRKACRRAVAPDIIRFKLQALNGGRVFDGRTGTELTHRNSHVHHTREGFEAIVRAFIRETGIDIRAVKYQPAPTGQGSCFFDQKLEAAFRRFHAARATLMLVSEQSHAELTRLEKASRTDAQ